MLKRTLLSINVFLNANVLDEKADDIQHIFTIYHEASSKYYQTNGRVVEKKVQSEYVVHAGMFMWIKFEIERFRKQKFKDISEARRQYQMLEAQLKSVHDALISTISLI